MRRVVRASDWPFSARTPRVTWRRAPAVVDGGWPAPGPDPWSDQGEAYPGASALADVGAGTPVELAAARLAVVRLVEAVRAGGLAGAQLAEARAAALAYIRAAPCGAEQAAALRGGVALAQPVLRPALAVVLSEAAAAASAEGSAGGAGSLWRLAYRLAAPMRWQGQAAAAAAGMERLARADGSRQAAAFWHRRARRHARRAAA